jgi:long-chain acyl-CoA synthetase
MDSDGWFHTGDIGILTPEGALKIVDRKKNIFKLSQGEYIAVEKLEATFKKAAMVEQVWVYGNSFKSSLVAVVVPLPAALKSWAKETGLASSLSPAELCADPRCAQWCLDALTAVGKADKLKGFELVKAVHVEPEAFSVEADLLTPSFKYKRPQLQKRYQKEIDAMYKARGE